VLHGVANIKAYETHAYECLPLVEANPSFLSFTWFGHETSPADATVFGTLAYNHNMSATTPCSGPIFRRFYLNNDATLASDAAMTISYRIITCPAGTAIGKVWEGNNFTSTTMGDAGFATSGGRPGGGQWDPSQTLVLSTFGRSVSDVWNDDSFVCVFVGRRCAQQLGD
jgi:hypothetical protein